MSHHPIPAPQMHQHHPNPIFPWLFNYPNIYLSCSIYVVLDIGRVLDVRSLHNHDHIPSCHSPRTASPAPLPHDLRGAAHVAPAAAVASQPVAGAYLAAAGVHDGEVGGAAQPVGADAVGVVVAAADDAAAVEPPAVAAQKLAHLGLRLNYKHDKLFYPLIPCPPTHLLCPFVVTQLFQVGPSRNTHQPSGKGNWWVQTV